MTRFWVYHLEEIHFIYLTHFVGLRGAAFVLQGNRTFGIMSVY